MREKGRVRVWVHSRGGPRGSAGQDRSEEHAALGSHQTEHTVQLAEILLHRWSDTKQKTSVVCKLWRSYCRFILADQSGTIQWKLTEVRLTHLKHSQPTNLIILLRLNFSLILQFLSDEPQTWHRPSGCSDSVFSIFSNGSDFQNSSIRLPNRSTFPLTFNEGVKTFTQYLL